MVLEGPGCCYMGHGWCCRALGAAVGPRLVPHGPGQRYEGFGQCHTVVTGAIRSWSA